MICSGKYCLYSVNVYRLIGDLSLLCSPGVDPDFSSR